MMTMHTQTRLSMPAKSDSLPTMPTVADSFTESAELGEGLNRLRRQHEEVDRREAERLARQGAVRDAD